MQWLDELLPEDAAELCRGRVRLVVTEVPSLRLRYLEDFASKQDLIDANSELPGCCAPRPPRIRGSAAPTHAWAPLTKCKQSWHCEQAAGSFPALPLGLGATPHHAALPLPAALIAAALCPHAALQ